MTTSGVQASIKEKLPPALYIVKEVCRFFHMSAKRTKILKSIIYNCCLEQGKKNLFHCVKHSGWKGTTWWLHLKIFLEPILLSLLKIEENPSDSAAKTHALNSSISQFQVNLFLLNQMLSTNLPKKL